MKRSVNTFARNFTIISGFATFGVLLPATIVSTIVYSVTGK